MQVYNQLSGKWIDKHKEKAKSIFDKHEEAVFWLKDNLPGKNHIASGALGGLMLLTAHATAPHAYAELTPTPANQLVLDTKEISPFVVSDLINLLPQDVRELTPAEEDSISTTLTRDFNIPVSASVNGLRLNRTYGYIGQEQHLARYPGDSMGIHFTSDADRDTYTKYGMAPGLGAWGYFASSKDAMTPEISDQERYYIAVQTFLSPNYTERAADYRDFYKFRKMLVVNPQNGKAVVAVIGDVGPAPWTGKHLGGSPEIMKYLERYDGAQKGPVLYFFITDPDNKVTLGPIETR